MPPQTLFDFYTQQGKKLPSLQERAATFEQMGHGRATDYRGTADQNGALLQSLMGAGEGNIQGTANEATPTSATAAPQFTNGVSAPAVAGASTPSTGGGTPPQTEDFSPFKFATLMSTLEDKIKAKNGLVDQRGKLLTALYDRSLTQDELSSLDPQIQHALQTGDKREIEMMVRLTNDQIKGRTDSLDSGVKYLSDAYEKEQTAIEKKRQDAIDNVMSFVTAYGSNAKSALKSLYGQNYIDNLKKQGIDIDKMGAIPTLQQTKDNLAASGSTPTDLLSLIKKYPAGTKEYKVAQDLAYGKLRFADFRTLYAYSRDINAKTNIYALASQLNSNFDPSAFELGYTFAANPRVRQQIASADNVISMMPHVIDVSNAAARSGITALNKIIVPGGILFGGKKYTNLATAVTAFADELSGALGFGSATDMSRQMGYDMTDISQSPENFASNMQDIVLPFIQSKKAAIIGQMGVYGGTVSGFGQGNNQTTTPPTVGGQQDDPMNLFP